MVLDNPINYYNNIYFYDDNQKSKIDYRGIKDTETLKNINHNNVTIVIAIGSPAAKYRVSQNLKKNNISLATIIDSTSLIRETAIISSGSIIGPNSYIGSDVKIGGNVLINSGSVIGHDTIISSHVVINRSCISGNNQIKEGVEIGVGVNTFPNIVIGAWSRIAMGSSVFKTVEPNITVAGNPARSIAKRERNWYLS